MQLKGFNEFYTYKFLQLDLVAKHLHGKKKLHFNLPVNKNCGICSL